MSRSLSKRKVPQFEKLARTSLSNLRFQRTDEEREMMEELSRIGLANPVVKYGRLHSVCGDTDPTVVMHFSLPHPTWYPSQMLHWSGVFPLDSGHSEWKHAVNPAILSAMLPSPSPPFSAPPKYHISLKKTIPVIFQWYFQTCWVYPYNIPVYRHKTASNPIQPDQTSPWNLHDISCYPQKCVHPKNTIENPPWKHPVDLWIHMISSCYPMIFRQEMSGTDITMMLGSARLESLERLETEMVEMVEMHGSERDGRRMDFVGQKILGFNLRMGI